MSTKASDSQWSKVLHNEGRRNKSKLPSEEARRHVYTTVLSRMRERRHVYDFADARLDRKRINDTTAIETVNQILKNHQLRGGGSGAHGLLPEDNHVAHLTMVKSDYTTCEPDPQGALPNQIDSLCARHVKLCVVVCSLSNATFDYNAQLFHHILTVTGSPQANDHAAKLPREEFEAYLRFKITNNKKIDPKRADELLGDWYIAKHLRDHHTKRKVCCVSLDAESVAASKVSKARRGRTTEADGTDDSSKPLQVWIHMSQVRVVEEVRLSTAMSVMQHIPASKNVLALEKVRHGDSTYPLESTLEAQPYGKVSLIWPIIHPQANESPDDEGMSFEGFCHMLVTHAKQGDKAHIMSIIDPATFSEQFDWVTPLCDNVVPSEVANRCACCDNHSSHQRSCLDAPEPSHCCAFDSDEAVEDVSGSQAARSTTPTDEETGAS